MRESDCVSRFLFRVGRRTKTCATVLERLSLTEVVLLSTTGFRQISTWFLSPETKFGESSSDAVQAYVRKRPKHENWSAALRPHFYGQLVSPYFTLRNFCLSKATALRSTNRFAYLTIHPDLQRFSPRTPTQLL